MPREQPPRLRISEPADIAQIVPYLVGFTPENSLVVSAVQQGRIEVTARVDLNEVQPTAGVEALLQRIWTTYPNADGLAVAYTDDHLAGWDVLSRCDAWLPRGCITMLVDADTWHTADGSTATIDPNGAVATEAARSGLRHLPTRTDLAARFASPPDSDELDQQLGDALPGLPAADDIGAIVRLTNTLIDRNLPRSNAESTQLSATDAIQLSVLAQHPAARDLALLRIDRDNAHEHLTLWQQVIRASPAYGADMPLYLAGMAAWVSGDGASAAIALERASDSGPGAARHPARLLEGIIDHVIPPSMWDALCRDILDHAHEEVKLALAAAASQSRPWPGWPPASPAVRVRRGQVQRRPPGPGIAI